MKSQFLVAGLITFKFFHKLKGRIISVVYTECYSTEYRAIAITTIGGAGRFFAALSPFIVYGLYVRDTYLVFLIFALMSFVPMIALMSFPVDATG